MSAGFVIVVVALFLVFWLLVVRPQRRRQAEHRQMLDRLERGDEIVTAGGLYGTVRALDEEELVVEIAPGTDVRLARRAVAAVLPREGAEAPPGSDEEGGEEPGTEAAGEAAADGEDSPGAAEGR